MANERFAADQGHVHGPVFANEVEYAVDERVAAEVTELA
jgi:hypothetical protein